MWSSETLVADGQGFLFQVKRTSPCQTYLCALENPFLRMSSCFFPPLPVFLNSVQLEKQQLKCVTLCTRVVLEKSTGTFHLKSAPLHHYFWLDPTCLRTHSPSLTRPYNSLPCTQTLHYISAEPGQDLHLPCEVTWFCGLGWVLSSSPC